MQAWLLTNKKNMSTFIRFVFSSSYYALRVYIQDEVVMAGHV